MGEPTNQDSVWENLAGKSCGKFLQEILTEKSCRKFLCENLAGKSCGKVLLENLAGNSCRKFLQDKEEREKANLRKAVIGGNLAFGIG